MNNPQVAQSGRRECPQDKTRGTKQISTPLAGNPLSETTTLSPETTSSAASPLMRIPPCMLAQDAGCATLMKSAPSSPPCTTETLRELDAHAIQHNLNLRIDLCYDHDLFFQPISGKKGDAKRIESEKYWLSLVSEFRIYFHDLHPSCPACSATTPTSPVCFAARLPAMFRNLKDIVELLLPESEHEEIGSRLDGDLLMQQVRHGVLDIAQLSDWLASLLTSHCAPMRDETARAVATQIRSGSAQADMHRIVGGIEQLFALLELMKLDVANHQIRILRYALIEDTVTFQQECFARAIADGSFDTARSQRWFAGARADHDRMCSRQVRDCRHAELRALVHGLVHLCNPTIKRFPHTLQYDYHRFIRLQEDLQDLVQLELCLEVFDRRAAEMMPTLSRTAIQAVHAGLQTRIITLTEDEQGNGGAISDHLDAISIELARSLCALRTQSTETSDEWAGDATVLHAEFEQLDKVLYERFQEEDDEERITRKYLTTLEECAATHALQFLPLSSLEISNHQRQWTQSRSKSNSGKPYLLADLTDMARRIAHVGVVHWKVWAELCYVKDDSVELSNTLISPVSVYGDERFYGDELSDIDMYSPTISSSPTAGGFASPPAQPMMNPEFKHGFTTMPPLPYPNVDVDLSDPVFIEVDEDVNNLVFDQEFDMDLSMDASKHTRKSNVRRSSM